MNGLSKHALIAAAAAIVAIPATAQAAGTTGPLSVVASGTTAAGPVAKRVNLDGLQRADFRVVSQKRSSLTLAWPRKRSCLRVTISANIDGTAADAGMLAQSLLPDATSWGTSTTKTDTAAGDQVMLHGAWRTSFTVTGSSRARFAGVAAAPVTDSYGHQASGTLVVKVSSRTTADRLPCAWAGGFRVGPGIESIVRTIG